MLFLIDTHNQLGPFLPYLAISIQSKYRRSENLRKVLEKYEQSLHSVRLEYKLGIDSVRLESTLSLYFVLFFQNCAIKISCVRFADSE
jgi:hypothetical protein